MHMIKSPAAVDSTLPRVFLAGSIEMGVAEQWQERLGHLLEDVSCVLLNPRRDDWDSSWTQSIDNPQFCQQVNWELDGLEAADIVVFYFDPQTRSPITLMELGLVAMRSCDVVVCCPEGFWRKGNVDIVCSRYGIHTVDSLEAVAEQVGRWVASPLTRQKRNN